MTAIEIKENIHKLVDTIEDASLLEQFHELLHQATTQQEGYLWNTLTKQQQEIVLKSYEESKNPANLMSADEARKTHRRWHIK